MSLLDDLGPVRTSKEVGERFGVDARTVRKYYWLYGGVEVAPGHYRFFENRIREIIYANTNAPTRRFAVERSGEGKGKDLINKVVRGRAEGTEKSNRVGGAGKQTNPGGEQEADPHGIRNPICLGHKLPR
jgi:hypothetical protein